MGDDIYDISPMLRTRKRIKVGDDIYDISPMLMTRKRVKMRNEILPYFPHVNDQAEGQSQG